MFVLLLSFLFAYDVQKDDVLQHCEMLMILMTTMLVVELVDEHDDENQLNEIVVDEHAPHSLILFYYVHDDDIHFQGLLYLFQQFDQVQELFHE